MGFLSRLPRCLVAVLLLYIFRMVKAICYGFRNISWMIMGIYAAKKESMNPKNYYKSAHILNVWLRYRTDEIVQQVSIDDFILFHGEFGNPDDVLFRSGVTIYSITDTEVVFVQTEGEEEATDVTFVSVGQYRLARRVIVVPLHSFFRACERLHPPKTVTMICNTARCGSTLMIQYFQQIPTCLTYGEPESLNNVALMKLAGKPLDMLEKIIDNMLKFMCSKSEKEHLIIKLRTTTMILLPFIHQKFPTTKFLFMYRDFMASAKSLTKICVVMPIMNLTLQFGSFSETLARKAFSLSGSVLEQDYFYKPGMNKTGKCSMIWVLTCRAYLELQSTGFPIKAFKYEHWMAKPEESTSRLLEYLELPQEWTRYIFDAMKEDSQRGSPLSRKIMANITIPELDKISTDAVNKHLHDGGLPLIGEPSLLQGTLTVE